MTRDDVTAAGGPSASTVQRIEEGKVKTDIKHGTKADLEHALDLGPGWIDDYLAGRLEPRTDDQTPVVIEGNGERLLVAIADGVSQLSLNERKAVLALVRALQEDSHE